MADEARRRPEDPVLREVRQFYEGHYAGIERSRRRHRYYDDTLARYGFAQFTLYGPAHGTGSSEVEGLWLGAGSELVIQPGMQFNMDIWLSDGQYGLRYEDGILVTQSGVEELTSYRREIIIL